MVTGRLRKVRSPCLPFAFAGALILVPGLARGAQGLTARVSIQSGPYYVGQAIELDVATITGSQTPRIFPPRVADAELTLLDPEPKLKQVMSSAIGEVVDERIQFTYRFRLVPRTSGSYRVSSFVVREDRRSGSSAPFTLTVRDLPASGRPASFLGGVGNLKADAQAQPSAVRVGQPVEYEILLRGSAARGSTMQPDLQASSRLTREASVKSLGSAVILDPPSRTFRYQLRPVQAGSLTIPPVPISYFDPRAGRYFTTTTPSISVRVVDVPRFNPDRLAYGATSPLRSDSRASRVRLALWFLGVPLAAVFFTLAIVALWRRRPGMTPQAFALRTIRWLRGRNEPEEMATLITSALTRYLALAGGRPEGALTPSEARAELDELSGAPVLGLEAAKLIARCDQVRFGGRSDPAGTLGEDGIQLFEALTQLNTSGAEPAPEKNQGRQSRPPSSDRVPPQTIIQSSSDET